MQILIQRRKKHIFHQYESMTEEETKRRTYPKRGDLVTVRPSFFRLYTKMAAKEGSYRKETLDSVYNKLVCRKSEIDLLLTLFGDRGSFVSPSIFICGHTATGKTVVVETLLKDLEVSMLFI